MHQPDPLHLPVMQYIRYYGDEGVICETIANLSLYKKLIQCIAAALICLLSYCAHTLHYVQCCSLYRVGASCPLYEVLVSGNVICIVWLWKKLLAFL